MRRPLPILLVCTAWLLSAAPARLPAQQQGAVPFWETHEGMLTAAAAQMVASRSPLGGVGVRLAGSEQGLLWPEWQFTLEEVPELRQERLDLIKDRTPIPDLRAKAPDEIARHDWAFYLAYNQALHYAAITPPELFRQAGAEWHDLTYAHLIQTPERYRGEVVPITGRLMLIRRQEAPVGAQRLGVKHLYEAYIKTATRNSNPAAVIFTTLPEGLTVGEDLDRQVTFYGYFLKNIRYEAVQDVRYTPLLIGPTLYPEPVGPTDPGRATVFFSREILIFTMIGLLLLGTLLYLLAWFFSRGDKRIHGQLAAMREKRVQQFEDERHPEIPAPTPNGPTPPPEPPPPEVPPGGERRL